MSLEIFVRLSRHLQCWAEPELRRTTRLLRMANTQLDQTLREKIALQDLAEKQAADLRSLHSDNRELKVHVSRLEEGNKYQLLVMDKLEARLREMEKKYEYMMGRVMQYQAAEGKPIDPNA